MVAKNDWRENNPNPEKNYIGKVVGSLTVVEQLGRDTLNHRIVRCSCVCGKEVIRRVDTLKSRFASCGCMKSWRSANRNHRGWTKPGLEATAKPTVNDIYWVAGIYEGEGSVTGYRHKRMNGEEIYLPTVTVHQVDRWLIDRMRALFGGTIALRSNDRIKRPNARDIFSWTATGSRARGFMMTIYSLLSPRRQEAMRMRMDWLKA